MSDSSVDEHGGKPWIPYSKRREWFDVKPLEQNEGKYPVAQIAYSDKFVDVFNYFRAIVCSGEISQRALDLTQDAAELNPANYSVWHHRRFLLKKMNYDLKQEMEYCRAVIEETPKNYQVWQHRRALVEALNDGTKELRLTEIILSQDAKNYHAWQHRQWAIKRFNLFDGELEYVERLLQEDIRNNSAWNQRFFIVSNFPSHEGISNNGDAKLNSYPALIPSGLLERELKYIFDAIKKATRNESAWNYLRGLLEHCSERPCAGSCQNECDVFRSKVYSACMEIRSSGNTSPYLLSTIMDLDREDGWKKGDRIKMQNAIEICMSLANEHDVIRKEYWSYMADSMKVQLNSI